MANKSISSNNLLYISSISNQSTLSTQSNQPQIKFPNTKKEYYIIETLYKDVLKSVYKVCLKNDKNENNVFCLKKIILNIDNKVKYINEIEILKTIKHSHIVKLYHYFYEEDILYIVYEYCNGQTLKTIFYNRLSNLQTFTFKEILQLTIQVLSGLMYLHGRRIVHREINLNNLIYHDDYIKIKCFENAIEDKSTENFISYRLPFEVECLFGEDPYFMSPEVAQLKDYDSRVDVWSLGIIILMLATMEFPYVSNSNEEIRSEIINKRLDTFNCKSKLSSKVMYELLIDMLVKEVTRRIKSKDAYFSLESEILSLNIDVKYEKNSKFLNKMSKNNLNINESFPNENIPNRSSTSRSILNLCGNRIINPNSKSSSNILNLNSHLTPKEIEYNMINNKGKIKVNDIDIRKSNFGEVFKMVSNLKEDENDKNVFPKRNEKKRVTIKDFNDM